MITVKYIDPEEYTEEGESAYELAKNSEINILSDKELYAITTDGEVVTGALFVNNDSDSFSFDVVIHPEYRRQGIGRELSKVAMSEYEDRKDIYGDSYYLMVDVVNEMFAEFLIKEYGLNIYEKQGDHTLLTDKEIDEGEGYSEDDNLMESSNGNMVASRIKTETNLLLDHGADGKYTKLKDNTYLCEEGSYVPRSYADNVGGYVITCKVDSLKVLDLSYENRDNLKEQPGGFKISGTDPEMYSFINDVISPESAEKYSQYGLNVFSKILGGMNHLDKLIKYAKSLGCDALKFRDESFDTMIQDFTYVVFDGNKLQVVNIVDPESEEEWKVSEGNIVLESLFVDFINQFKTQENAHLIEAIEYGYNVLQESELTMDDIFNDPLLDELDDPSITDGGQVIAYHGTNARFDKFDKSHIGTNFKNTKDGYFFSDDMDYVTWLANKLSTENGGDALVYKCKLTLGRTYTLKNYFDTFDEETATKMYGDTQGEVIDIFDSYRNDIISKAKYNKCDSVNFRSLGVNLYVVFDSNQIEIIEVKNKALTESVDSMSLNDVYGSKWDVDEYEGDIVMESLFVEFINQFKTKDNSNLIEAITDGYLVLNESVTRELMYLYQYLKTDDKSDLAFNEPWYLDEFDHGIDDEEFNEYLEEYEYSEAVVWLYHNDKDTFERFVEYVESHNDEGQEGHTKSFFDNSPKILKNKWLLHFTDNAYDIFKDGFNRGTDDIDKLGLTTYRTSTENGTYGFAYDAANTSSRTYSANDYHRMFKYGQEAVMFIASGIKVYHYTDEEDQVIFDTRTVRDIVAIEKVSIYMEDDEYDVWGIRNKRGENLFTAKDDSLESFEQTVDWVIANYDNYRKNIDTGKAPSMREPGKNRPQIESIDTNSNFKSRIEQLAPKFAEVAMKEYNNWVDVIEDPEIDEADVYYGGGICHIIADKIIDVLNESGGFDFTTYTYDHEQHVVVIAKDENDLGEDGSIDTVTIDVPWRIYETGGGFSWEPLPRDEVDITADDVVLYFQPMDSENWDSLYD